MRRQLSSLGIALLFAFAPVAQAASSAAATEPRGGPTGAPPAVNTRNSAVFLPAAPAPAAGTAKPASLDSPAPPAGAAKAGETGKATTGSPADPGTVEMTKLKHQIKTTRLSLAETQGRLSVTEKDLASTATENTQLRADTTNLRVGLAKAETVAKKSEEELGHRRQEVQALQVARRAGAGTLIVILLLALVSTAMLAVVLFGHGRKLRAIMENTQESKADDRRLEQLRAELKEEQQRAQRYEAESQRLRVVAESQSHAPPGSKREKLEHLRREVREAQAAAEAEKRRADERIQKLEAEMASIQAGKQEVEERVSKLEPELAQIAAEKQALAEQVRGLEPELARLSSDKLEAEERSRLLARDAARLTAEKLRLEQALAKANDKLTFFGHDGPEDTLPPVVG